MSQNSWKLHINDMTMQLINMFLLFWTVVEGNFILDQQFINLAAEQRTYCVERVVGTQSVITSAGCSFRWVRQN